MFLSQLYAPPPIPPTPSWDNLSVFIVYIHIYSHSKWCENDWTSQFWACLQGVLRCFDLKDVVLLGQDGLSAPSTSHCSGCLQEDRRHQPWWGSVETVEMYICLGWDAGRSLFHVIHDLRWFMMWCTTICLNLKYWNYISELLIWWHGRFPAIFMMISMLEAGDCLDPGIADQGLHSHCKIPRMCHEFVTYQPALWI